MFSQAAFHQLYRNKSILKIKEIACGKTSRFSKTISPFVSFFLFLKTWNLENFLSLILWNHKRWRLETFTNVLSSLRSSFYLFAKDPKPSSNSYCPWNFRKFNKNTNNFLTYVVESSDHLELKRLPFLIKMTY